MCAAFDQNRRNISDRKYLQQFFQIDAIAFIRINGDQLSARRMYQLQLLTKRNEAAPAQTWGQDAAQVLASGFDAAAARRLQNALKALLKKA